MPRVSHVEPQNASAEVKEIYNGMLKGEPDNLQKVMAHRPMDLKNFTTFFASVGRGLERRLYSLVYIRVSVINHCNYCTQHHIAASKRYGLNAEDWMALCVTPGLDDHKMDRFSEKERMAIAYAGKLTLQPHAISDSDVAALKRHFSEGEIVDLTLLIGLANLTNRFTDPLGVELEFTPED